MRRWTTGLVLALAACGPAGSSSGGGSGNSSAGGSSDGGGTVGTAEGLPSHAPSRFAFGSEASSARVAMWDIDVRPDGIGLPAGSGTVEEGRQVYELQCVACHGPSGTEGPNDRLVGRGEWEAFPSVRTVGSYWPYSTTLFDYIRRAMPQLTPGLLTADETYAVSAYVLFLNEIVPNDATMDAETLPAVVMPARDRFVLDDRQGGSGPVR